MPIKTDYLKQYVSLRQSLLAEKNKLEARLKSINHALGGVLKAAPVAAKPAAPAKKKHVLSAAARAKIAAAQKVRWAKFKAAKAAKTGKK